VKEKFEAEAKEELLLLEYESRSGWSHCASVWVNDIPEEVEFPCANE